MCRAGGVLLTVVVVYCVLLSLLLLDSSNHEGDGAGGISDGRRWTRGTGHLPTNSHTPPPPRTLAQVPDYTHNEELTPNLKPNLENLDKVEKVEDFVDLLHTKKSHEYGDNGMSRDEGNDIDYYDDDDDDAEQKNIDYNWYEDNYKKYKGYVKHIMFSDLYQPGYVIENGGLCKENSQIFVFINSRVNNTYNRHKIRETYLKKLIEHTIPYGFLISKPEGKIAMQLLKAENDKFGDVVVTGSEESYFNLTLKTAHLLHWAATNCLSSTYIVKVDDDVYVNVEMLLHVLSVPRNYTILGKVCTSCVPFRGAPLSLGKALRFFSNVATTRHMPLTAFPPFAMGPSYVITPDMIPLLMEAAQQMVHFSYEDVFWTGLAVEVVNGESGLNIGVPKDPKSIKEKYVRMVRGRTPITKVQRRDVPGWRMDLRPSESLQASLEKARHAVIVHNVQWYKDKQFILALQNINTTD
ncbi:N-acetyllactosaminide beta-1,3-N-acetylglucosaminyltransferase 2-like [Homarus americanus]|uniref:Hexosyltransferase n=1 Tax=Homarus americanus TaxID=6706 RepID=A0A8J5MNQ1_HOMAM|nr:N-acetyllactosaminide beta-1,3-N-acetylglucosaminyltransferase 2-like [Homarus americanus]KAG7158211.1 Beta-1-3-galactosyltransferase 1-like 4 [Homarus americanus]